MRVALIILPGAGREAGTQERLHLVSAMSSRVRALCRRPAAWLQQQRYVGGNYNGAAKSADVTGRQADGVTSSTDNDCRSTRCRWWCYHVTLAGPLHVWFPWAVNFLLEVHHLSSPVSARLNSSLLSSQ